jgi:hypothetical protein
MTHLRLKLTSSTLLVYVSCPAHLQMCKMEHVSVCKYLQFQKLTLESVSKWHPTCSYSCIYFAATPCHSNIFLSLDHLWCMLINKMHYTEQYALGSNPGGGKIFCTHPDQPWGPPSLQYNGYWVAFPGRGVDHPPHRAPRLKKE